MACLIAVPVCVCVRARTHVPLCFWEGNLGCGLCFQRHSLGSLMLSSYLFVHCFVLFGSSEGGRGVCPDMSLKRTWKLILGLHFSHPLTHDSFLSIEMFGPKVRALPFWSRGVQGWCRRLAVSSPLPWDTFWFFGLSLSFFIIASNPFWKQVEQ